MAEGDSAGSSERTDEHECKICYNYYDLHRHCPKLLGCSHTFCLQCLETLHSREGKGWRIGCPVCRHRTPVQEYRVQNLPDNTELTEAISHLGQETDPAHVVPSVSSIAPGETDDDDEGCENCKHAAFALSCVCAIFSFLSTVVLLFLGLIFVHNFNHVESPVGPVCLFVACVLALLSLILTWLICMLKYRPDTEASHFN